MDAVIEGPHTTPGASVREEGALTVLKGKVKIGKRYEATAWDADSANAIMTRAITNLGARTIDGVYAANDVLAAGAISALKAHWSPALAPRPGPGPTVRVRGPGQGGADPAEELVVVVDLLDVVEEIPVRESAAPVRC